MKKTFTLALALFFCFRISAQTVDLSTYVRVGRYNLPEPTRTAHPANSLLAQEASAVTYNWDTHTLFVVGDGGTSVVQVSKTGELINSMTLAPGSSPQGTDFYDPEGITYIGNGQFVMSEERDRQAVLFTYVADGILTRGDAKTVKLGTFVQNIGNEGVSFDPITGGYIFVKETQPEGVFQTNIDFVAGTATNGSATTDNPVNLFNPASLNLLDFADVFALSNLPALQGKPNYGNLLVLSQESAKIVNTDRLGNISSSLTIVSDPGNPLDVVSQQHEGLTMDPDRNLYVVSENGGGDFDHPQLWVYAPSSTVNQAPTLVTLNNAVTSIAENTSTLSPIKVADIVITDDGQGTNNLYLTGADSGFFQINSAGLYIKAGVLLDYETKNSYHITVNVDDSTVGPKPDAKTDYTFSVTDVVNETPVIPAISISEVAPWSSGNSPFAADWFEVTNNSSASININGWKMDDNSNGFATSVALNGISSIAPGESVIFLETATPATTIPLFLSTWFGSNIPAGLQVGSYTGSGVGLSTGGDAVNLYSSDGILQANVSFGSAPAGPFATFNNAAASNNAAILTLSKTGENGAFAAANDAAEIGSPGTVGKLLITEVAPWSSGNSPVAADWFELTNTKGTAVDITGWKIDDNSGSFAAAVNLSGISTIASGESVIFMESATPAATTSLFRSTWFGTTAPASLQIGTYSGSGVGLGTGGDAVNIYNSTGILQASVIFGASSATAPYKTFDNAAGLNNTTITQFSESGINGAFIAKNDISEIGSPGRIATIVHVNTPPVVSITGPSNHASLNAGVPVSISVSASDEDGNVIKTELFVNGILYGTDSVAPYSFLVPASSVEAGNYTLTAKATDNNDSTTVSDSVVVTVTECSGSGGITGEGYTNIPGSQVADLQSNAAFPNSPTITAILNTFEYSNIADNYGGRVRGYFCAPETGLYRFNISGDDQAGLWLSTDDNAANKTLIAYTEQATGFRDWSRYSTQQSAPIPLVKGARYYIETLQKEAGGSDHLSVAVTLPSGFFEGPIQGVRLSPVNTSNPAVNGAIAFASAMVLNSREEITGIKVTVAPNPSTNYFTLKMAGPVETPFNIKVVDAQGRLVESKLNVASGTVLRIGEELTPGIYFVIATQGSHIQRLKLVKQ